MISPAKIKPKTPIVCSDQKPFGVVDHMYAKGSIKLGKDADGVHHYIPLSWVASVDDTIHLDRSAAKGMEGWSTTPLESPSEAARFSKETQATMKVDPKAKKKKKT